MKARIQHLWATLVHEHTSPARLAMAVWLGIIVGCSPFFGFHLLLTLGLAFALRLNKLVMYAAAQVSIPPLVPFLGYAAVQVGHRLTTGAWLAFDVQRFRQERILTQAQSFFIEWTVGGLVIGTVLGGAVAAAVYIALRLRHPLRYAVKSAAERYRHAPPAYAWYARLKYRMDPVYVLIASQLHAGERVVDLGAGIGMLGVLLDEIGVHTRGIEWDEAKVCVGRAIGATTLEQGDITAYTSLPPADAVTIIDVLHYFDEARIMAVLDLAKTALQPGGRVFVREGDLDAGRGAGWTRLIERVAVAVGWNKAPAVRFLTRERLLALLDERGFEVTVHQAAGIVHPGNLLFVATSR